MSKRATKKIWRIYWITLHEQIYMLEHIASRYNEAVSDVSQFSFASTSHYASIKARVDVILFSSFFSFVTKASSRTNVMLNVIFVSFSFLMTDDDAASLGFCLLLFFCLKSLPRRELWKNSQWFLYSAPGADGWKLSKSRVRVLSGGARIFIIY